MPDAKTARRLARGLVASKLAACVTAVNGAESVYRWKGRIERTAEKILIVKTAASKLAAVEKFLKKEHPYELPEILAVGAASGSREYLEWIRKSTS